jgi:peroxiredoxin-like protein
MTEVSFYLELNWTGTGRDGAGEIQTDDLALEFSGPKWMGGRGAGTNPEELLVCAVSSCYTATLFSELRRAGLPVGSLAVGARGTVTGVPRHARFARIVVRPTIFGGDVARQGEYEAAAHVAHHRCFIGRTLAPDVAYQVGSVRVQEGAAPSTPRDRSLPAPEHRSLGGEPADQGFPIGRVA